MNAFSVESPLSRPLLTSTEKVPRLGDLSSQTPYFCRTGNSFSSTDRCTHTPSIRDPMPSLPDKKLWRRVLLACRQPEHNKECLTRTHTTQFLVVLKGVCGSRATRPPPSSQASAAEARKVLKVGTDASQDDIRSAYKRAALRSHPLENPEAPKDAKLRYRRVRAAYLCLWECASKVEKSRTNWRPSETCISNEEWEGWHQTPTFEDAEKAFNATFGRVNPKLDQQTRQMQSAAIENKLSRANTMHSLFGATPSHSKVLDQCSSPLRGSQHFDPKRLTA